MAHDKGWISGHAAPYGALEEANAVFVEVNAPINGGTSGGPIVDYEGSLVGIVSQFGGPDSDEGTKGRGPRPHLTLPVWVWNRIVAGGRVSPLAITNLFDRTAEAVCECVTTAELLIQNTSPDCAEAIGQNLPEEKAEFLRSAVANGFTCLVYRLKEAERLFASVSRLIRELYTLPPGSIGDVSGPSFHDMGLQFAESTFARIQIAAQFNSIWMAPIHGVTEEHIMQRAQEIGQRAETMLPRLWKGAPCCDAQRLRDCIKTEAANAVKKFVEPV